MIILDLFYLSASLAGRFPTKRRAELIHLRTISWSWKLRLRIMNQQLLETSKVKQRATKHSAMLPRRTWIPNFGSVYPWDSSEPAPTSGQEATSVHHTVQYSGDTFTDDVQFLVCRMHIPTYICDCWLNCIP